MTKPVRVLYDISIQGFLAAGDFPKTGVSRVIDHVAKELVQRDDVDLTIGDVHSLFSSEGVPKHLALHPELKDVPVARLEAGWRGRLGKAAIKVANRVPFARRRPHRIANRLAHEFEQKLVSDLRLESGQLESFDVLHATFNQIPDWAPRKKPVRVTTVYDLIPIRLPEYKEFSKSHYEMTMQMVERFGPDDWLLAISEYTRQDFLEACPSLPPEQVLVTPLAASSRFRPSDAPREDTMNYLFDKDWTPDTAYFLSLCTLERRKNLETTVRAFHELTRQTDRDVRLALIGPHGWRSDEIFPDDLPANVRERIVTPGFAPDDELPGLYSHATAFLYLSMFEGFGLPPLEAMQCGTPAITSNVTSLPEVVGDAGFALPPQDVEAVTDVMKRLLDDDELQAEYRTRGLARAEEFSWAKTAQLTAEAYRTARDAAA